MDMKEQLNQCNKAEYKRLADNAQKKIDHFTRMKQVYLRKIVGG